MKKLFVAILGILILLSLCACINQQSGEYTYIRDGIVYTVDPAAKTVSDGKNVYRYAISGSAQSYKIDLTYPNGATFWWKVRRDGTFTSGFGGWSDDYDSGRYTEGAILCDALEKAAPQEQKQTNFLLVFILIVIGIVDLVSPHTSWYLAYGWRFRNAEPSDLALDMNRIGGVFAILAAMYLIFA